ncbi:MAG TPA: pantetheine-phosphate adenylyltransferase [Paludibacteraceae bacterium]|nr:pantetheine-phosphate adenylyltransferase [Paludibacteraceae bacterium]
MVKIAIFPGSFDPFTKGHYNIVERGLPLFDRLIIGIGRNTTKAALYTLEERQKQIEILFANEPRVEVRIYDVLTADFAQQVGANYILRGVRTVADFEYERTIAEVNKRLIQIETVLLFADTETATISSSLVRELKAFGKDVTDFLPEA